MVAEAKIRVSAAEYFALPETTQPMQLIEGEIIMSPSPVPDHQKVTFETGAVIRELKPHIGGEVFIAPLDVYLDDDNVVQPDVMWLAPQSQCVVGAKHLIGAPELVVEVLSFGSVKRDKVEKFRLYARFGVREYWILDPIEKYLEAFSLHDGQFELIGVFTAEETFTSPLLNQPIPLAAIFAV
jgi:Uma2 family endonuclease